MKRIIGRRFFAFLYVGILCIVLVCTNVSIYAKEEPIDISSPSVLLMEASTGKIIYEKNADEQKSPASITKIMTLLLIFDAIKSGKINLSDEVVTSAYAKSMGGSQVFLEEGEVQTVDTLIKCITVASGNDASVCMAEYIAGSEEAFVAMMNQRAKDLGLQDAHFVDCCGLTNSDEHHVSAKDVAIIARELISQYPKIYEYSKIWMEDITHVTKQGTKQFTLSSTNKLLKQYEWATGLKTGSTGKAKYCFCATANKNGINLIAVVMGAGDSKTRFAEAKKLLDFGYQNIRVYEEQKDINRFTIPVKGAMTDELSVMAEKDFYYVAMYGEDTGMIDKKYLIPEEVKAPITSGSVIGEVVYCLHENEIGRINLVAMEDVKEALYFDYFRKISLDMLLL